VENPISIQELARKIISLGNDPNQVIKNKLDAPVGLILKTSEKADEPFTTYTPVEDLKDMQRDLERLEDDIEELEKQVERQAESITRDN